MASLKEVIDRYAALSKEFGEPVPLSTFNFGDDETSRLFTALEEDYHISRFLHFSRGDGQSYLVGGESVTHLAIDPGISSLL